MTSTTIVSHIENQKHPSQRVSLAIKENSPRNTSATSLVPSLVTTSTHITHSLGIINTNFREVTT